MTMLKARLHDSFIRSHGPVRFRMQTTLAISPIATLTRIPICKWVLFQDMKSSRKQNKKDKWNPIWFNKPTKDYIKDIQNDPVRNKICKVRILCRSLAENIVNLLIVTNQSATVEESRLKKGVCPIFSVFIKFNWLYGSFVVWICWRCGRDCSRASGWN